MIRIAELLSDLRVFSQSVRDVGLRETARRIPRYLRTKAQEDADGFDQALGTETSRIVSTTELCGVGPHQDDAVLYWPTRPPELAQIMEAVGDVDHRAFVFVDLGCGKGRVLLLAARLPFRRVIGVDFSPALAEVARQNVALCSDRERCGAVEVICADAAEFALPEEDLMLYLFNPFGPRVLGKVLDGLKASLAARPRRAFLLYNNCVHGDLVASAGFKLLAEGHGEKWPWQVYGQDG
jgi:SAM-dependent methyltransferase